MKSLVLVGGIEYSGKSSFASQLEQRNPERFRHVQIDAVMENIKEKIKSFYG